MHSTSFASASNAVPQDQVTSLANQQIEEKLATRRQKLQSGSGEAEKDLEAKTRESSDSILLEVEIIALDLEDAKREVVHDIVKKAEDGTPSACLHLQAEAADADSFEAMSSQNEHNVCGSSGEQSMDLKACLLDTPSSADLLHRIQEPNLGMSPEELLILTMPSDEFFISTPRDGNPEVPDERGSDDCAPCMSHISGIHLRGRHSSQIRQGYKVKLHIYDVSREPVIHHLNNLLANEASPIKFGGVFHAAIEIRKVEWSYGSQSKSPEVATGVRDCEPKADPKHSYRQTMVMGETPLSKDQIAAIVDDLKQEYVAADYDLLRKNCCHFADDLCRRLGVTGLPRWLLRLAGFGAGFDELLQQAPQPVRELLPW
eukprot:TRINITY_DN111269_c0_g1_i1.p1 TRINITY_DN111269_c0_g1~~TRINITY_DN111269_c0_g1_i1.p1  ORF type:complete len:391 (-),score=64.47 TRINITY_DN111269_c0_g1_i1:5-1123(-)